MIKEKIEYLYKYRPLYKGDKSNYEFNEHTLSILQKGELYFSTPKEFNDPFDCWVPIKYYPITVEMVKSVLTDNTKRYILEREKLKNIIKKEFNNNIVKYVENCNNNDLENKQYCVEDIKNRFISSYYISCFSKRNDKTLMWSHYSDCHNGICIGFKAHYLKGVNALDLNLKVNSGLATIEKVNYRKDNHKPPILSRTELTKEDLITGFLSKSKEWIYEEEYRVILSPQMTDSQIQYIDPKYIKEIYFGMRTSEEIIKSTINEIKNSNFLELELINFYKMRESKDRFSVIPIEINYKEYLI